MLKEERHQYILKLLHRERKVIATELSTRLNVSEDTIRRDLRELDSLGLIRRVHSGALIVGPPVTDFEQRQTVLQEAKVGLAKSALPLITSGQVILIDGGTTNLHLAHQLPLDLEATVITNSPPIATALKSHAHIDVIMLGGNLYKQSLVNLGAGTVEALSFIRVDLYFIGIYNIHPQIGITFPNQEEAYVKRKMIAVSTEVAALVTLDKFGTAATHLVAPTSSLTYLVTEPQIDREILEPYAQMNIAILQ